MTKVVIDRRQWYRGHTGDDSCLLREDRRMCCLGFAAVACGIQPEHLLNRGAPSDVQLPLEEMGKFSKLLDISVKLDWGHSDNKITDKLIETNDFPELPEQEREEGIIRLGANVGFEFSFIN